MQDAKNKIEAVLFTLGKFVGLEELSRLTGIASLGYLKEALDKLKEDYKNRDSGIEIFELNDKWKLSIKKDYLYLTESLLSNTELDRPTQETLAVIAYKNPILQSEIINIRGNKAYDHVKTLKELDFVTSEKSGRTRLLKITPKFFDYFDVVEDQLKSKLDNIEKKETAEESIAPNKNEE